MSVGNYVEYLSIRFGYLYLLRYFPVVFGKLPLKNIRLTDALHGNGDARLPEVPVFKGEEGKGA